MIGTNTEKDFTMEDYNEFYSHHSFQPMGDEDAFNVHEIIPRFGWAFDRIEALGRDKKLRVLDLGCLEGSFLLSLITHQPNIEAFGVDLTEDGIKLARERAAEKNLNAIFEQGTIEDLLSQYAHIGLKFDVVTAFEIMEHVKDPEGVIKAIDKVLSPDGTVLFSTPDFESPLFGKDDEINKCHIRLFTTALDDYEAANKYGTTRKATSLTKMIRETNGLHYIENIEVMSHLINCEYGIDNG